MADLQRQKWTPPQVAKMWGLGVEKVLEWIRSGELTAMDAALRRGGRPRYLVDRQDLEAFERSRQVVPSPPAKRTRRRAKGKDTTIEYF